MKKLDGTKTAENLLKAFAGESQARNRYTFFAKIAEKEGFVQMRNLFLETAENERVHGKRYYTLLAEGLSSLPSAIEINAMYPVALGSTYDNLIASATGEHEEWEELYPEFASIAESEGFKDVATAFRMVASAERWHEIRFLKLADNLKLGNVFKKDIKVSWKCAKCGYIHESNTALVTCPCCLHPQAYFELFVENY